MSSDRLTERATALKERIEKAGFNPSEVLHTLYGVRELKDVLNKHSFDDVERQVDNAISIWIEASTLDDEPVQTTSVLPSSHNPKNQSPQYQSGRARYQYQHSEQRRERQSSPGGKTDVVGAIKANYSVAPDVSEWKTLTGVRLSEIPSFIDAPYPKSAYGTVPLAGGQSGTDLNPYWARLRLDQTFGPAGIGWRIVPSPNGGTTKIRQEKRTSRSRGEYTVWVVTLEMWQLEYVLLTPEERVVVAGVLSDSSENENEGYAYRGAHSSLLKQFLRLLGGTDHFVLSDNQ